MANIYFKYMFSIAIREIQVKSVLIFGLTHQNGYLQETTKAMHEVVEKEETLFPISSLD